VSFGGAYSNHIHALAYAGKLFGFNTVGIIRGEYDAKNPTIIDVKSYGMTVEFITRQQYKRRHDSDYLQQLQAQYPNALIVPEGGSNQMALYGLAEVMDELSTQQVDYLCCPCGSGGTTAGLIAANAPTTKIISVPVLKDADYLKQQIIDLVGRPISHEKWDFIQDYHFGGYAKLKPQLLTFIEQFYHQYQIQLEPVYSGKMFYAVFDLIKQGYFPRSSHVVLLHTGGLQGINGMQQRNLLPANWLGKNSP